MKIEIKVDLGPDEVEQAARLIEALRALANRLDVNVNEAPANGAVPAPASPPPQKSAPVPASSSPVPDRAGSANGRSSPKALAPQGQIAQHFVPPFQALLHELDGEPSEETIKQVAASVEKVLVSAKAPAAMDGFLQALASILYNKDTMNQSRVPYMSIIPLLSEQFTKQVMDRITREVLSQLTAKREVTAERQEFFVYADLFGIMVLTNHIKIHSAVATISKMLASVGIRCAGITMLGKLVELCHDQLSRLANEPNRETLDDLHRALAAVDEPCFVYDRNYVADYLGWTELIVDPAQLPQHPSGDAGVPQDLAPAPQPAAAPSAAPEAEKGVNLVARAVVAEHSTPILAIAWASSIGKGISSDRDGGLITWVPGEQRMDHSEASKTHMFTSIDLVASSELVLLAGTPRAQGAQAPPPVLASYSLAGGAFTEAGRCPVAGPKLNGLACLPSSQSFVTAERVGPENVCCLYDATRIMGLGMAAPLQLFKGDKANITCLAASTSTTFVCGASSGAVTLWDSRQSGQQTQVAGLTDTGSKGGISSISASSELLAAGALNNTVRVWDMRSLAKPVHSLSLDASAVKCVRLEAQKPSLAAATMLGLYYVSELAAGSAAVRRHADAKSLREKNYPEPSTYHALSWAAPTPVLFTGGEDGRVDVYVQEQS